MILKKLPGLNAIARDYLTDFDKVAPFFSADYRNWTNYQKMTEQVRMVPRPHRRELVQILLDQNSSWDAGDLTQQNIHRLGQPDAVVVATGQQVGLFTGPLYTIYKALTMIKLSKELAEKLRTTVVPVFYLVSEDHDFTEVKWAGMIDKENRFQRLLFQPLGLTERTPVSDIALETGINDTMALLESGTHDTEFKDEVLAQLRSCYRIDFHFHTAFARYFHRLFAKYGIVMLDAADSRLKALVSPVFERELEEQITIHTMKRSNAALAALGYPIQVPVQEHRPSVFILKNGRHALERRGDCYIDLNSKQSFSVADLLLQVETLSPKVGLRPIVQDTLFPTIAYVGGPGEIAYWAQLKGVYDAFQLPMPVVFPRAGFTWIEPKVKRHLDRFGVTPEEFLVDAKQVTERVLRSLIPQDLEQEITQTRLQILNKWRALSDRVVRVEPTMQSVLTNAEKSFDQQIRGLEQKIFKAIRERESIVVEQVRSISENLLPEGKLQERQLNGVPFLIKYGPGFLDRIYQTIDLQQVHHRIVEL